MDMTRFSRQLSLPGWTPEVQERLQSAHIVVVGAGGLGCPALTYLVAAGVGRISIIDPDRVALSNLHRQPLYRESDIGLLKVQAAATHLQALNRETEIIPFAERLDAQNAFTRLSGADVVLDCSDNFPTRYLINDACGLLGIPMVYGALYRFEGQMAVWQHRDNGDAPVTYRCLFPEEEFRRATVDCATAGTLGAAAGVIGTLQASEALKLLTGISPVPAGCLFTLNLLTLATSSIAILRDEKACAAAPASWEELQRHPYENTSNLTVESEDEWILDVRETYEQEERPVPGAFAIPFYELRDKAATLPRDRNITVCCASGYRSALAVRILQEEFGFSRIKRLMLDSTR